MDILKSITRTSLCANKPRDTLLLIFQFAVEKGHLLFIAYETSEQLSTMYLGHLGNLYTPAGIADNWYDKFNIIE